MKKIISFLLMLLVFISMFPFQLKAQDIKGKWHGKIDISEITLRLDLEVEQQANSE